MSPILSSPFFGEEYSFRIPREFQWLTFYLCEPGLCSDSRLGKVAIAHHALFTSPSRDEQWYNIRPIDADSEVQVWCGKKSRGGVHLIRMYAPLVIVLILHSLLILQTDVFRSEPCKRAFSILLEANVDLVYRDVGLGSALYSLFRQFWMTCNVMCLLLP